MQKYKDWIIMSHLRRNARARLTDISRTTELPVSTIFDRLNYYKKHSTTRFTTLLDFTELGFTTRAHILLKSSKKDKDALQDYLTKNEHTNSVYKVNNGYDYLIECIFTSMNELEDFLDTLEEKFAIKNKTIHYIMHDVKREAFLSDPQLAGMLHAEGKV